MAFYALLEFVAALLVIAFVVTQLVVPLWKGTPVCWLFRKSARKDIEKAKGAIAQTEEEREAEILRQQLDNRRRERSRSRKPSAGGESDKY